MGTEDKKDYVLMATMPDGKEVEIGEFSGIAITDMEEILRSIEFRRVVHCKNCEHHLKSECPCLNNPDPEFFCADGLEKVME